MTNAGDGKLAKVAEVVDGQPNEKLVAEAARHIKKILDDTVLRGATEVGAYLFKEFFDGDAEKVRSRNPNKDASFRALADLCGTPELPVSKSFLHNAVGIAVASKVLPERGAFRQLPSSHQVALLPLRDPDRMESVAEKAVNKDYTVRQVREVVQKEVEKKKADNIGRPKLPVIVKTLNRSLKLFTLESGRKSFTKAQVNELDEKAAGEVRKKAEELMESLKKLIAQLPKE